MIIKMILRTVLFVFKSIKFEFKNFNLKFLIFIILLSFAWMGIAPTFYKIIMKESTLLWLERIFKLFDNNLLLNIPVCTCLIFFCIKMNKRMLADIPFGLWRILLIIFAIFLLYYKSPFEYANIIWIVDYRRFILLLFFSLLYPNRTDHPGYIIETTGFSVNIIVYCDLLFLYENGQQSNITQWLMFIGVFILFLIYYLCNSYRVFNYLDYSLIPLSHGFLPDYNTDIKCQKSLIEYANSIVNKLLYTDLTQESFAVGITSEWGAGKSTFLRLLKKTIGNQADIVEFNPWMCRTPEQLTNDFFSSLSHQLSKSHLFLSRNIIRYVRKMSSITIPGKTFFSFNLSNLAYEGSLFERKKKLSQKLLKLKKPVIIIIDDVDRLEREEVFEVLRLIRNTADLCNVIYLVAYDKDYVTSVLNEKPNIKDASMYMEKIFQIEIQLPMVPEDDVFNSFIDDLETQIGNKKIKFEFSKEEEKLIKSILTTYRRAKRFARLFSLNYSHLQKRANFLEWRDVFWLDMLQMQDRLVYDTLRYNPNKLLEIYGNYYVYDKEFNIDIIDEKTYAILLRLWGSNKAVHNSHDISNIFSFSKYFTLQYQLSDKEIDDLLSTNNYDDLMKISEENGLVFYNLWNSVKHKFETNDLNKQQKKSILIIVLNLCYNDNVFSIKEMLRPIRDNLNGIQESDLSSLIISWLKTKLSKSGNRIVLSAIVGNIAEINLLKKNYIRRLIEIIIQDYLNINKLSVDDLLDYDSDINMIIRYLYLRPCKCDYGGQDRRNDAFNYIIDCLLKNAKNLSMEENVRDTFIKSDKTFIDLYDDNWKSNYERFAHLCHIDLNDISDSNTNLEKGIEVKN